MSAATKAPAPGHFAAGVACGVHFRFPNLEPVRPATHTFFMRLFPLLRLTLIATLLGGASVAGAAPVEIVRIWSGYRTASSFDRIGDYLRGGDKTGGETVRRSQPGAVAGYYFLVRLKNPGDAVPAATFDLQIIAPSSPDPRHYSFKADLPAGSKAIDLGLTGPDWPDQAAKAVAWQLTVRGSDGRELANEQSFLWSLPAAH